MGDMESPQTAHKSGFVAVMGRSNVGKSTLINALFGQKIAAVSSRPQTTRKRQMCILTIHQDPQNAQIAFVDTPGIHTPRHKLGELMNREAVKTLEESDLILFVVDVSQPPNEEDFLLIERMADHRRSVPVILALNKIDKVKQDTFLANRDSFLQIFPPSEVIAVSALQGENLKELLEKILLKLPTAPAFFPDDQLTDLYERDLAADLIRESALNLLRDEVPHGIAIRIDQYIERNEHGAYIEATIFVERESHKAILIGKDGSMLKKIGSAARKEIELMSGRKVFLRLNAKVRKNWRDDEKVLRSFGYS
jgi:GTP-binding protein Era